MDYKEALEYIHGTLKFGSKLGLKNITELLELMGNPQKKLQFVHVAGTNGKGSTVAFISNILMSSGYKVGIYTSPYIQRFTERIKINNDEISQDNLAEITSFVKEKIEVMLSRGYNHPTEFEVVTAIAMQYYLSRGCDIAVLEVGLGGRFDSTNVIETPMAAVITSISYDHMDILGDTLSKIAFEKAGIIKEQGDVVFYPQSEEVERVISDACLERHCRLLRADFASIEQQGFSVEGQSFNYKDYKKLSITLLGEHQIKNAVVAVETCELLSEKGFNITEKSIREGLKNTKWPGRLEVVNKNPVFLIDGAHNAEGAEVLADALRQYFPDKRKIFIFGVLKDKDYRNILEIISPLAYAFITVTPNSPRALPAHDLADFVMNYCKNVQIGGTIEEGIKKGLSMAKDEDIICAFGSLYYIGDVRDYFVD